MGTPYYMSPEQIEAANVDHRSDIFAVGAVMYELLTFQKSFPGEAPHNVLHKIMHAAAEPIRNLLPGIDPALEQVVHRNLEKDPARRYQDLDALAGELESIRSRINDAGESAAATTPESGGDQRRGRLPPSGKTPLTDSGAVKTGIHPIDEKRRAQIEGRRRTQVEAHLQAASGHLQTGAFEDAIEQCEHALVLSSEEPRALEMLQVAHRGLEDRQVANWLSEAHAQLSQGELTAAQLLIEQAQRSRPDSADVQRLQADLRERRREAERLAERARAVRLALERARANLEDGSLDAALRCASEALAHDPASTESRGVRQQILAAIAERRQREEQEQRAYDAVVQARQRSEGGDLEGALTMLEGFAPSHQVVTKAIADLQEEIQERDRQRAEEAARRQREQEEQQRREALARQAREREEVRRRKEEEETRRRREAEEKDRQARVQAHTQAARASIDDGRFDDAAAAIEQARLIASADPGLPELINALTQARSAADEAARRRRQADEDARDAEACLNRNELTVALRLATAALAAVPGHPLALQVQSRAQDLIEAKRREDAVRRDAEQAIATARRGFATGDVDGAIQELEKFRPRALVAPVIEELVAKRQAAQARRTEAEARRLEAERQAQQTQTARQHTDTTILEDSSQSAAKPADVKADPLPPAPPIPVPDQRRLWDARLRAIAVLGVLLALAVAIWQAIPGPDPPGPEPTPTAKKNEPPWELELKAAQSSFAGNDLRSALTQLLAILKVDPAFAPATDLLNKTVDAKRKRVDRARADANAKATSGDQAYKEAAQSEAAARKATGDALGKFELLDAAERKYNEAASAAPSAEELGKTAADAYRRNESERAIQTYLDGLRRFPGNDALLSGLKQIRDDAHKSASDARIRAEAAGKSQTAQFKDGLQSQKRADSMMAGSRAADQVRLHNDAARLFKEALATPTSRPTPLPTATPTPARPDPLAAAREALQRGQSALARNDFQTAEQEAQSALRGGLKDDATSLLNDINRRRADESARTLRQRVDSLRAEATKLTGQARVKKLEDALNLDKTRTDVADELAAARKDAATSETQVKVAAIKKTLRAYESAFGRLKAEDIVAVAPLHNLAALSASLKSYSAYTLTIDEQGDPTFLPDDTATVKAKVTRRFTQQTGRSPRATEINSVVTLMRRADGRWVITSIHELR